MCLLTATALINAAPTCVGGKRASRYLCLRHAAPASADPAAAPAPAAAALSQWRRRTRPSAALIGCMAASRARCRERPWQPLGPAERSSEVGADRRVGAVTRHRRRLCSTPDIADPCEYPLTEVTQRSPRGHSEVTRRSLRGHSEVTQRSLRGHLEVTQMSPRGHTEFQRSHRVSEITQWSHRGHSQVTQGHSEVIQGHWGAEVTRPGRTVPRIVRGAPKGDREVRPPWDLKNTRFWGFPPLNYLNCNFEECVLKLFAMWENRGSLQHGNESTTNGLM